MERVIWKWTVERGTKRHFTLEMPENPQIMTCQVQTQVIDGREQETLVVWAFVNPTARKENVRFQVVDTGLTTDGLLDWAYVGTFQLNGGDYVGHLFVKASKL